MSRALLLATLWLLAVAAQAATAGKPVVGGDVFGDVPMPAGANKAEMLEKMTAELLPVLEMVGNVRLQKRKRPA